MNLKVGGPVRSENGGGTSRPRGTTIIFLVVPLHFLDLKVQLVVLVSAFVIVSTILSVSCLLFFTNPSCPAICKSGGTCPRAPWSRHHCTHIVTSPTYPQKFIRDDVIAPFLILFVVIVTATLFRSGAHCTVNTEPNAALFIATCDDAAVDLINSLFGFWASYSRRVLNRAADELRTIPLITDYMHAYRPIV